MSLNISLQAELELRRRRREGTHYTAPDSWDKWLPTLFPKYFSKPFAERHVEMWNWLEAIRPGIRPRPFLAIWGRGGAKSMNAEGGVIRLGAKKIRKYVWYISDTQSLADEHVATISSMLENSETSKYYPQLADRALNKFGHSKGWRRSRVRTRSGFTVDALGLDVGARGMKIESDRPDLMIIDDIDGLFDKTQSTLKKLRILTQTILPSGSTDCAVLFVQNLISPDSIASRLLDGRTDMLSDRIVSGPHPAVNNLEYTSEVSEDGSIRWIITGGEATWEGQNLEICEFQLNQWGPSAFLREAQHEVDESGGIWKNVEWQHVSYDELSDFVRTAVWVDPAVSSTDESDCMGISAGGIDIHDKITGFYWWEDITTPEDALERAIKKAIEYGSLTVGVETDNGGDTWKSVFNIALANVKTEYKKQVADGVMSKEEFSDIQWPRFTSEKAGGRDERTGKSYGSKVERNAKMLTAYERGDVRHMRGTHSIIEKALRRFPNKPLDVADSWFWCWNDLANGTPLVWENEKGEKVGKAKNFKSRWTD